MSENQTAEILIRKSTNDNKAPIKEKFVGIYEAFFRVKKNLTIKNQIGLLIWLIDDMKTKLKIESNLV